MESETSVDLGRVAQDFQLKKAQVASVVELLDSGNTVPFITRYRKEMTGGLDEEQIRAIQHRIGLERQLIDRRQTILRTIESQDKLTDELREAILRADSLKRLEDLYLPYKPKKQTLATVARERGLGPLADAIWARDPDVARLDELLPGMINPDKQLQTVEDVLTGIQHILAEKVAEDAEVRQVAREVCWSGRLQTARAHSAAGEESRKTPVEPGKQAGLDEFRNYFQYEEPIRDVPPHRILAINRGERRGVLRVRVDVNHEAVLSLVKQRLSLEDHPHRVLLETAVNDAVDRLLLRSLEREIRGEMAEFAERHAVEVFARNLRHLLLQPPIHGRKVLAIDPGYVTGCKWAVVDEIGNLIEHGIVYPHLRRRKKKRPAPHGERVETDGATAESPPEPDASETPTPQGAEPADVPKAEIPSPAEPTIVPDEKRSATSADAESQVPTDNPPTPPMDSVHRSTGPDSPEDHGLEAEISREWKEISGQDLPVGEHNPLRKKSNKKSRRRRRPGKRPASAGIVIPPPGLFDEEPTAEAGATQPSAQDNVSKRDRAKHTLADICRRHGIDVVAIGNGTACRETEELLAEMIADGLSEAPYVIVNEAGASVYSTSPVGREEFPEFDATLRSAISIGRRLQDPLSELVKIDPQNIGVGLYQHDINPRLLKESLSEVVESCVNYVGVDLNTASVPLLRYVSGLNQLRARNLVEYRRAHGPFQSREQIKEVSGIGPETFTQAAGFLKITGGEDPIDSTWIHPESYATAAKILERLGYDRQALGRSIAGDELRSKLGDTTPAQLADQLGAGEPTIWDILDNLVRPGRDPREDLPKPIFKTGVLRIEDLQPGMELNGTVLNVVDFGVFVDIGLKDSGLVHISQMANRFIRSPHDVVCVGDIVKTWVLQVDMQRRRVSMTMIDPNHAPREPRRPRGRPMHRDSAPAESTQRSTGDGRGDQAASTGDAGEHRAHQQAQQRGRGGRPDQRGQQRRDGNRQGGGRGDQRGRGRGRQQQQRPQEPRVITSRREKKPPIKLSDEKITGKQDLFSFGELKALFEHRKQPGDQESNDKPKKPKDDGTAPAE